MDGFWDVSYWLEYDQVAVSTGSTVPLYRLVWSKVGKDS